MIHLKSYYNSQTQMKNPKYPYNIIPNQIIIMHYIEFTIVSYKHIKNKFSFFKVVAHKKKLLYVCNLQLATSLVVFFFPRFSPLVEMVCVSVCGNA